MQQRKDEILAKKAKLAEIKRQRELRQKEFSAGRQSIGEASEIRRSRLENRDDIDSLISSLVGEGKNKTSTEPGTPSSASRRQSRPLSYSSPGADEHGASQTPASSTSPQGNASVMASSSTQTLSIAPFTTVYEIQSEPSRKEILTYSKGIQTDPPPGEEELDSDLDSDDSQRPRPRRLSRRQRERDEELRQNIRREIEAEFKAVKDGVAGEDAATGGATDGPKQANFPARELTDEELNAVTSSEDFLDFVDRSTKVIERALDEEYDVLADYRLGSRGGPEDDDDDAFGAGGRRGRRVKESVQFYEDRWNRKRMISDINFSPKFPELVLASYTKNPSAPHDPDGLVQVWNLHMHNRPEYTFHAQSDILAAKFSPYHPNLIIGGSYSGQVLLWDTRSRTPAPVQKTPLTGSGHTHPVYALNVVGTQNAHNIISLSTDGVVCSWSIDMFMQPQEYLELTAPAPTKTDDLAPTCSAFPASDPTYFLSGSEEGTIHLCHRYDRAGAKAGVDTRVSYAGHSAPVMALDFHRTHGPIDLGDLVLSAGLDWSVKLWRVRTPASTSNLASTMANGNVGTSGNSRSGNSTSNGNTTGSSTNGRIVHEPLLEMIREDVVYDAKWSPVRPGVFGLVDGAGALEIWDLTVEVEVPVAKIVPTQRTESGLLTRSLNRLAWEPHEGRKVAVGGLDGVLTLFEVGSALGGAENARADEWSAVKKLVARLDTRSDGH